MKRIVIVTLGISFFFLFCFNTIQVLKDRELGVIDLSFVKLQASAAGVEACYDSKTYYSDAMPGYGYEIIYGEECYNNNGDACGKNQYCQLTSRGTAKSCYDLSC